MGNGLFLVFRPKVDQANVELPSGNAVILTGLDSDARYEMQVARAGSVRFLYVPYTH